MERSSCGSLATEATSVLNMRPSDFPRPPTQTSMAGSRFMLAGTEKRKSLRMVARSDSINDDRSLEEKRISFIKKRASTTLSSPLFSASLGPHRRNGHGSTTDVDGTSPAPSRRSKRIKSQLTSYSESSSIQPTRSSNRLSQRIRSTFAPNFPRVITRSTLAPDDDGDSDKWETSSESSSSIDLHAEMELADEMALPRHERSWVLPNEASPTPPPTAPPSNRRPSIHRASTPNSNTSVRRTKPWTTTSSRSISPLAAQALDNASASLSASAKISKLCRSRLSEPMALTSKDSLSKVNAKTKSADRPRLVHRRSGRPVSVEDVQRLSSLRAERVEEEEEVGAGALLEDGDDAARERVVTDGSGKVFI
jgi:axial budding pattern protein 2